MTERNAERKFIVKVISTHIEEFAVYAATRLEAERKAHKVGGVVRCLECRCEEE